MKKIGVFAILALVTVMIFLIISIVQLNVVINRKRAEELELTRIRNAGKLRVEELNQQISEEITPETIKRIAREKLNLRDPGVIICASDLPN